jgi:hypothetical protein
MFFTNDISNITQFGIQTPQGCFPYSDRLNQIILESIRENIKKVTITCISAYHREVHLVDTRNFIVERIHILDGDMNNKERFYGLIGKQSEKWVRIVPDIEYPEFAIEYFRNEEYVHYFRIEAAMAVTNEGVLVMYSDISKDVLFIVNELIKIGKMEKRYREMNIRHVPFDVKFYYSVVDKDIVRFEQSDIHTEEDIKYILNSKNDKIYLDTIRVFESFSPETRKRIFFKTIYDELIQKSYEPSRYYNWCLDTEDRFRISKLFIV